VWGGPRVQKTKEQDTDIDHTTTVKKRRGKFYRAAWEPGNEEIVPGRRKRVEISQFR